MTSLGVEPSVVYLIVASAVDEVIERLKGTVKKPRVTLNLVSETKATKPLLFRVPGVGVAKYWLVRAVVLYSTNAGKRRKSESEALWLRPWMARMLLPA